MKRIATLIVASSLALVAACGWTGTGTVVQKDYDKAWTQHGTKQVCTTYGTPDRPQKSCSDVPDNHYWPESFQVQVKDGEGKKHWVDVPEREYDSLEVGDTFTNGEAG